MAARLTPAASSRSDPTLVGTPVMTNAPVMIESVASSSARSAPMLAKCSMKRPSGAPSARQVQPPRRSVAAMCAASSAAPTAMKT